MEMKVEQHHHRQSPPLIAAVRLYPMHRAASGLSLPAETHRTLAKSYYEKQPDVEDDVIAVDGDTLSSLSSVEISLNEWRLDTRPSDDVDRLRRDNLVCPIECIISDSRAAVVDGTKHPAGCGKEESVTGRRRNARERDRVRTINSTFARLRQKLPQAAAYFADARSTVESTTSGATATTIYRARKLSKASGLDHRTIVI
jgi:hypothetical protein